MDLLAGFGKISAALGGKPQQPQGGTINKVGYGPAMVVPPSVAAARKKMFDDQLAQSQARAKNKLMTPGMAERVMQK